MQEARSKTVYVLGAGFSYDGGAPLQSEILQRIREHEFSILNSDSMDDFFRVVGELQPGKKKLEKFFDLVFPLDKNPSLEDVFTLLDQTISKRAYCRGYSWKQLDEVRNILKRLILNVFYNASAELQRSSEDFYKSLAAYFLAERLRKGVDSDPLSIVSLNWDTLLEDSVYWCINNMGGHKKIDVDFGCYTIPLDASTPHVPSVLQKAQRIYNIKILKLHGSANWLLCPNCEKLYTGVGSTKDTMSLYAITRHCTHCGMSFSSGEKPQNIPQLEPFFITPTYMKIFDNLHFQTIWHNAYTELAEAAKIVFIGYSFPEADYHVRTLIRRSLRPGIPIDVVLTKADTIPRGMNAHKSFFAATRYKDFFSAYKIRFYTRGVKNYFKEAIGKSSLSARLRRLKHFI